MTRALATSPLRLLTPANHGHASWIYTSTFGGGLVDGDRVEIDVDVRHGAAAYLSTQASTKVYRSPGGTASELTGRIEPGGLLIVAPDPLVCFAGARYRQRQHYDLAPGAALALTECVAAGRCAAGERWAFREYRSLIEVRVGGRLILHDALALCEADGELSERLGRFNALAMAVIVGGVLRREAGRLARAMERQPVTLRGAQLVASANLADEGCLLRVAGASAAQVWRTLREWLAFVPAQLGDDPWQRKW